MKNIIQIILILFSTITFSQVTVQITDVKVENIPINQVIDLQNSTSRYVTFSVTLSKPQNFIIGPCKLFIRSNNGTGTLITYIIPQLQDNSFSTSITLPYGYDFYYNDFNFNGGFLYATLVQDISPFTAWTSNNIPVKKNPIYSITQNPVNPICNSPVSFTVNNNASGFTHAYQWSYGSGWVLNSTNNTGNTIFLIPTSNSLGTVSVTPSFNNVVQNSVSKNNILAPLTINPTLTGSSSLCPTAIQSTYTLAGVGAGFTVNWSLSSTTTATILSSNSTSAVVKGLQNGSVTLTATISNACNQQVIRNIAINVVANSASIQAPVSYVTNNNLLFYCTNPQNTATCGVQTKTIAITQDNLLPTNFQFALQVGNAQIAQFVSPQSCFGCTAGNQSKYVANLTGKFYSSPVVVSVKANYSCNISSANFVTYLSLNAFNNRLSTTNNSFEIKLSPNVARNFVTITKEEFDVPYQKVVNNYLDRPVTDDELQQMQNEVKALEESVNAPMFVSIYSMQGLQVYSNEIKGFETIIDVSKYTKGMYFVKINRGVEQVVEKLLVD